MDLQVGKGWYLHCAHSNSMVIPGVKNAIIQPEKCSEPSAQLHKHAYNW